MFCYIIHEKKRHSENVCFFDKFSIVCDNLIIIIANILLYIIKVLL